MYETGERESLDSALKGCREIKTAAIITGPEGGFAQFEADLARVIGCRICSMGERILRCETAPIVALSALMFASGNLE
jgi:16S rRNA (uracil1498-N3)-methyltransferase